MQSYFTVGRSRVHAKFGLLFWLRNPIFLIPFPWNNRKYQKLGTLELVHSLLPPLFQYEEKIVQTMFWICVGQVHEFDSSTYSCKAKTDDIDGMYVLQFFFFFLMINWCTIECYCPVTRAKSTDCFGEKLRIFHIVNFLQSLYLLRNYKFAWHRSMYLLDKLLFFVSKVVFPAFDTV